MAVTFTHHFGEEGGACVMLPQPRLEHPLGHQVLVHVQRALETGH